MMADSSNISTKPDVAEPMSETDDKSSTDSPDQEMHDADNSVENENEENGNDETKLGKRGADESDEPPQKKKKKSPGYQQPKNALMQLNELKPGLKYVFQSQEGPAHDPVFAVYVEVNGQRFVGKGNSKQLAKHAAAEAALASFVQFRNMPEAMYAMSKHINNADFTTDNVENEVSIFNKFEKQKNGKESSGLDSSVVMQQKLTTKLRKVITEADKKNPVMLLNELRPGLTFTLVKENASIPSQRFVMRVTLDGEEFEGVGQNKKTAKAAAARCVLNKRYSVNFNAISSQDAPKSDTESDIFSFPQSIADKIARGISTTFNEVMIGNPDYAKWKVLAGIVMTRDEKMEDIQIIGIGTGTKHLVGDNISMNGASLNDCHAEIISRRCLKDFLYTQLELHVEGEGDQSVFERKSDGKFALKPHHKFHLFISTSPCGDARIFSVHDNQESESVDCHPSRKARGLLRTKIESGEGTVPVKVGQPLQTLDKILQGQQRYLTMSCSDKIASWNILGIQGSLLSHFIEPIYLDSIILGRLFHRNHIYRAMCGRLEATLGKLPPSYQLNKPKMCSTTTLETRQVTKSPSFSINWTTGLGRPEIVVAKTGKLESGQVSRLSKRSFFQRFSNIYSILLSKGSEASQPRIYSSVKNSAADYSTTKNEMVKAFAAAGLGSWVRKPSEQDGFELVF